MKYLFRLFLLTLTISTISCDNEIPINKLPESKIFQDVDFYPDLGMKHNELLDDIFEESNFENRSRSERFEIVDNFIEQKFQIDVRYVKYDLFNSKHKSEIIDEDELIFDPFIILESNKDGMTSEVYEMLYNLFVETSVITSFEDEVKFINSYHQVVLNNSGLTQHEKNGIRNLLVVYKSSMTYWRDNYTKWMNAASDGNNELRIKIKDKDYQKIVWADIIQGIAGGFFGGPLGALVGLAAGSATMAISVM